jgi:hypothetical protein
MTSESVQSSESSMAMLTLERLDPGVQLHVPFAIVLAGKSCYDLR